MHERTDSPQDTLVVRVGTQAGITGWGEVDSRPAEVQAIVGVPASRPPVTGLRRVPVGEDLLEIRWPWEKMHARTLCHGHAGAVIQAVAGIDPALWDIKGKALGVPI